MNSKQKFDWVIVAFFVLSYAIAWSMLLIMNVVAEASGIENGLALMDMAEAWDFESAKESLVVPTWLVYLISRIADFSFTISGVTLMFATRGMAGLADLGRRVVQLRVPLRWYAIAVLPLLFYTIAAVVAARDPEVAATLDLSPRAIAQALIGIGSGLIIYFFARGAMGEEPGLRGFALDRMLEKHSPAKASAIIGTLWAGWHVPVLVGKELLPIVATCLLIFLLSYIFTWLYINSKRSLIPVLILHASQNSSSSFEAILPGLRTTDWELVSVLGTLIFGLIICGVLIRTSRRPVDVAGLADGSQ